MKDKSRGQTPVPRARGQSMVEFIVIAILLFVLLAAAVDLGNFFFSYIQLFEAAQEGVQFGSFCPDGTHIEEQVRANSEFPIDLNNIDIVVNSTFVSGEGNPILVEVRRNNFRYFLPFMEPIFGDELAASASARIITVNGCP